MLRTALKCAALIFIAMIVLPKIFDSIGHFQKTQQKLQLMQSCNQELSELKAIETRLSNSVRELEQKWSHSVFSISDEAVRLKGSLCVLEAFDDAVDSRIAHRAEQSKDPCGDGNEYLKTKNERLKRLRDKLQMGYEEIVVPQNITGTTCPRSIEKPSRCPSQNRTDLAAHTKRENHSRELRERIEQRKI